MADIKISGLPGFPTLPFDDTEQIPLSWNGGTYFVNPSDFLNQPDIIATVDSLYANGINWGGILDGPEIHTNYIQLTPNPTAGAGANIISLFADLDDTAKLDIIAQHVRFLPNTIAAPTVDVQIQGPFACNSATPQGKATVNAACTDLASAIALINQLRAALIANGICV